MNRIKVILDFFENCFKFFIVVVCYVVDKDKIGILVVGIVMGLRFLFIFK